MASILLIGVLIGSIYALISLGFNVIYRTTGVLNFAQGEFVMIGGVVTAWAAGTLHWPIPLAILAGMAAAVVVGLMLDSFAIAPIRRAGPVMQIIITIGASIVIKAATSIIWGTEPFHLPPLQEGQLSFAGLNIEYQYLWILAIATVCMVLLSLFFRHTSPGRAMQACAENAEAARLCGVRTGRMAALSFALSALLGGIAGILLTPMISMRFDQGTMLGLKGFAAAILGGIGNPLGGVIGGLLLGVLEKTSCFYLSSTYEDTLALSFVVLILLIRPRGLLSR